MRRGDDIDNEGIKGLLSGIGLHSEYNLERLQGGRNNRAFKLTCGGRQFFLKAYFCSPEDPRDRLHNEFSFTRFAWSNGLRFAPEPFGKLPDRRLALYEFIAGRVANYRPTTAGDIRQATDFILSVNKFRANISAQMLPEASEACFSLRDHIKGTAARVKRLAQIEVADDYDASAKQQVDRHLLPLWDEVLNGIDAAIRKDPAIDKTLEAGQRWISPSDFGFHNAIEEGYGRLRFVDFEYAGWDDPAKLLCDFANQPDRILDSSLSSVFIRAIIDADVNPEFLRCRYFLLEPLYQIKWACIILNDFLPIGGLRRTFTRSANVDQVKKTQLEKLDTMLCRVGSTITANMPHLN